MSAGAAARVSAARAAARAEAPAAGEGAAGGRDAGGRDAGGRVEVCVRRGGVDLARYGPGGDGAVERALARYGVRLRRVFSAPCG